MQTKNFLRADEPVPSYEYLRGSRKKEEGKKIPLPKCICVNRPARSAIGSSFVKKK